MAGILAAGSEAADGVAFQTAVANGAIVAIAVICLLQYAYHVFCMRRNRRADDDFRRRLAGLEGDLASACGDRDLTRMENDVLQDFVTQTELQNAVEFVLARCVPDSESGFAALVEVDRAASGSFVSYSRGLSATSQKSLSIGPALRDRVAREKLVSLEGAELYDSGILGLLSTKDRKKAGQLHLAAVVANNELAGVFVSTTLMPAEETRGSQVRITRRMMNNVAGNMQRQLCEEHQHSSTRPLDSTAAKPQSHGTQAVMVQRRVFDLQLSRELELVAEDAAPRGLIVIEVDRFSTIAERHGGSVAEAVISRTEQVVVEQLMEVRSEDRTLACRLAGGRCALLLPGIASAGAFRIADSIRAAVQSVVFELPEGELRVTLSAGVAVYPDHAGTADELFAAAEASLHTAQVSGKNRVTVSQPVQSAEVPA